MKVEFNLPGGGNTVTYEWGHQAIPRIGEDVHFDGLDPDVPEGSWRVRNVVTFVSLDGQASVRLVLRR